MRRRTSKRKTAKRTAKPSAKRGRPKGSRNEPKPPVVEAVLSRCRKCGSTNREPYRGNPRILNHGGTDADGLPYTRVVWRTTRCADCGQARCDKFYENEPT